MNESVRSNLSDKKKIKDLFLVVVKSIEVSKNKVLISSLVQFFSNLCYGTGKLRQMLAREDPNEIMSIFKIILDQIKVDQKAPDDTTPEEEEKFKNQEITDKTVLKNSIYSLIGNLCIDKSLRVKFANDQGGILSQVIEDFKVDMAARKFDYFEMATKQLAIFINVSVEECAQFKLYDY